MMNATESALRAIKDRVAAALGDLDETSVDAVNKENYRRLTYTAKELHSCANELQNILMRIHPR